jgi:hypothetical protein
MSFSSLPAAVGVAGRGATAEYSGKASGSAATGEGDTLRRRGKAKV